METTKVILRTKDNVQFKVNANVLSQSQLFKRMMADETLIRSGGIPALHIGIANGCTIELVLEYLEKNYDRARIGENSSVALNNFTDWEKCFLKRIMVDHTIAYEFLRTAYALEMKEMVDLACKAIAELISGKPIEEIRSILQIVNDFSPEEEEAARREIEWALL